MPLHHPNNLVNPSEDSQICVLVAGKSRVAMTVSPDINLAEMLLDCKAAVTKQMPELNTACSRIPPQPCETLIKSTENTYFRLLLLKVILQATDWWRAFSFSQKCIQSWKPRFLLGCIPNADVRQFLLVCPLHVRVPRLIRVVVKFPSPTPCCPSPTDDVTTDCVNTPNCFHKCDVTSLYLYTYKGVCVWF